jgi:hypothetical protein
VCLRLHTIHRQRHRQNTKHGHRADRHRTDTDKYSADLSIAADMDRILTKMTLSRAVATVEYEPIGRP